MNSVRKARNLALATAAFISVFSTVVYLAQGGFGGGHLRFDFLLFIFGLPWDWVVYQIPLVTKSAWISQYDLIWLVAIPFLCNVGVILALTATAIARGGSNKSDENQRLKISY